MSEKLRAHHGMCLAFFEGKGYSEGFTAHMQRVWEHMQENPLVTILVKEDTLCSACPNRKGEVCKTSEQVKRYDTQVLRLCKMEEGKTLRWKAFSALVEKNIIFAGKRKEICGDCEWSEICSRKETEDFGDNNQESGKRRL